MNKLTGIAVILLLLTGCASSLDGKTYSRDQARRVQTVQFGTIEAIMDVVIEGERGGVSKVAGGIVGGIAGSGMGGGKGKELTTVLGVIAGAVAGGAIEEKATRANAWDITVRMDRGRLVSIVQERSDADQFRVGDRVRILKIDGVTRVSPWTGADHDVDAEITM
ncbi:glycine zipper 2TM domain-containing protein [Motiliproteus sp. MSK22-1]|uniref:glycine zipper 2TM domain-containing protein n=1 Tax=Motiliproteus sp. MSK22-1 TaxID=1897630 RepID=UPI00097785CD|nr:glycine zipper 2TM domain-containing protein [Motiliproteus sp. MSK22-1]OMH25597.1 hypothetical protein BGP75_23905 [Motiliproteus sp. MSK22-1]